MAPLNNTREKEVALPTLPVASSAVHPSSDLNVASDLDVAFKYIQKASNGDIDTSSVNLAALRRRIDWRILPVMFLCSCTQFVDKVLLSYAAVMGLPRDLHLRGNDFSNAATSFFIAFLVMEAPNGYLLQKFPAGKWLGGNMILWGITTACTAAVTSYTDLLAVRILLGVFEAPFSPCLIIISSQWYTRREQTPVTTCWFVGSAAGVILGSFISFAFQHVGPGAALSGWRLMFLVLGLVTVPLGAFTAWALPDSPMSASWMSKVEKVALLDHVSENRTGIENRKFKASQVVELLLDVQMWLLGPMGVLISISSGITVSYSATIIRNFGYTPKTAALLNAPSGAVSTLANVVVACGVLFVTKGHRWIWVVACSLCGITAGALMAFAPASNRAALLTGVYLVSTVTPAVILVVQLTMANVAGHTKRPVAIALMAGSLSFGSVIGPETFRAKDAPQYHRAKIIFLATQAGAAVVAVVLFGYYTWANRQKELWQKKLESEGVQLNYLEDTWGNLTDKENVEFRYTC